MAKAAIVSVLCAMLGAATSDTVAQPEAGGDIEYSYIAPLATRALLLDGIVVDDLRVVVGEYGHILISADGGGSWRQAEVPTRATLTGVYFHDRKLGWAVGHDAVILRTRDGGESWERVHHAPEEERPFLDVWFRDAHNGFAIGAYGYFLVTEDGGDTWSSRQFSAEQLVSDEVQEVEDEEWYEEDWAGAADFHLNHIARSSGGTLYIAAEAGHIYRSEDEGATWVQLPSPYEGSFFGTLPLGDDSLLLFGLRGNLFRSDDRGVRWTSVESGTQAMLTAGLRLDDGAIFITGLAGALLVSRDGGRSFSLLQQPDRKGIQAAMPGEGGELILIGEAGLATLQSGARDSGTGS